MENWVKTQWRFFGPVKVALLSDSLFLFEFSSQVFAQKAVEEGCHSFNGLQISKLVEANCGVFSAGFSEGCFLGETSRFASTTLGFGVFHKGRRCQWRIHSHGQ